MKDNPKYSVLSPKLGGGPHNLGDPDDHSLRKVETDVLIPQKMREKAREDKCADKVKEFSKCCKDNNVLMVINCRRENKALRECLESWFLNEKFREECTKEYLYERSEYRRTGVPVKHRLRRVS